MGGGWKSQFKYSPKFSIFLFAIHVKNCIHLPMLKGRMENNHRNMKVWIASADMGLGHQRAAYPLEYMANNGILTANDARNASPGELRLWKGLRASYEFISRSRELPFIGPILFGIMNTMFRIPPFYPLRDLSKPSLNNYLIDYLVKRGLCRTLIDKISAEPLPLISTFYAPAIAAELHGYSPIYIVICDADINRAWVPTRSKSSNIAYFAPCGRVMRRLRQYGIPDERIFITGFPLPKENIGSVNMEILKGDMLARLGRLDPENKFSSVFGPAVEKLLGNMNRTRDPEPVTVSYAIGGAGAQIENGLQLAIGLRQGILDGKYRLKLIAGINRLAERVFAEHLLKIGLNPVGIDGVEIICEDTLPAYFERFNKILRGTDILWTKPSELCFYTALGIPLIMSPSLGAQEDKNRRWLSDKSCALPQYNPLQAGEWLNDMIRGGILAEKAFNGFVKNRKLGVYKIEEVLNTGTLVRQTDPLLR